MGGVVEKNHAVNAPHIVLKIGIVKYHGAFVRRRRKCSHEHNGGVWWQKWGKGYGFDFLGHGGSLKWVFRLHFS